MAKIFHTRCISTQQLCHSVQKQGEEYYLQVYVEKCKYTDAESQECNILIDSNDERFFQAPKISGIGVLYIQHQVILEDKFCSLFEDYKKNLSKQENIIEAVTGTKGAEYRPSEPYESKTRA